MSIDRRNVQFHSASSTKEISTARPNYSKTWVSSTHLRPPRPRRRRQKTPPCSRLQPPEGAVLTPLEICTAVGDEQDRRRPFSAAHVGLNRRKCSIYVCWRRHRLYRSWFLLLWKQRLYRRHVGVWGASVPLSCAQTRDNTHKPPLSPLFLCLLKRKTNRIQVFLVLKTRTPVQMEKSHWMNKTMITTSNHEHMECVCVFPQFLSTFQFRPDEPFASPTPAPLPHFSAFVECWFLLTSSLAIKKHIADVKNR